jgi:hypothetical protein
VKRGDEFWAFVRERHAIYVRRFVEGRPPPWTADPVLATGHFTNVYRELDPGTVYIRDQLRSRSTREKILNVWLYRFALHEESHAEMGWRELHGFDGIAYGRELGALRKVWSAEGRSVYHGAYYINNYGNRPIPKHEAIGLMADAIAEALREDLYLGRRLELPESREEWLTAALELTGFGDFIANQVLADLVYDGHVELPEDGHVLLGTGARRGLRLVAGEEEDSKALDDAALYEILDALWGTQPEPTARAPHLTRMNLQNCCCEWGKYERSRRTGGRSGLRRRFHAAARWKAQEELRL